MAETLYDQVVSAHRKTLDRLIDRGSVERLRNLYEKASAEVLAKLERLGRGSSSFTAHHLHMALAQVLSAGGVASDAPLIGAGVGRFLVGRLAQRAGRPYLHAGLLLAGDTRLAGLAADCAPAVAVARLAFN